MQKLKFDSFGDCKAENNGGNAEILINSEGSGVRLEQMRLFGDSARLVLLGDVLSGGVFVRLVGVTEGRVWRELWKSRIFEKGPISVEYVFDPVSLAVYSEAKEFFAETVSASDKTVLNLKSFAITEDKSASRETYDKQIDKNISFDAPLVSVFVGNSLLLGMGRYGMCSTAPDKDYFYHVSQYIKAKKPSASFRKIFGSDYEHLEDISGFEDWYNTKNQRCDMTPCEAFSSDVELVLIQLGDNINTDMKYETFKLSGAPFIKRIKESCPRARIIWVHGWYSRQNVYSQIVSLCEECGIERLDIGAARSYENECHSDESYVGPSGELLPIKDTWRTHPGDGGMREIADMIIDFLRIK